MEIRKEDRQQRFRTGLWLRVIAAGVVFVFLLALGWHGAWGGLTRLRWVLLALAGLLVANAGYWLVGRSRGFPLEDFYWHWAVDLVVMSFVVHGLGGAAVPASLSAYPLIIVTSAAFISSEASFLVATGAVVSYVPVVMAEVGGLSIVGASREPLGAAVGIFLIGCGIVFFYLFAFISGTVANQLRSTRRELEEKNILLAAQNDRLRELQDESDFQARILSHDLRTPLVAASVALQEALVLKKIGEEEEREALLQMTQANVERAEAIAEVLKEVESKGRVYEDWEEVDLNEVAADVLDTFGRDAEKNGIVLRVGNRLPRVEGSRAALTAVLRNLVGNAVKYVPKGGQGLVELTGEESGEVVRLVVKDNGPGISGEDRDAVFQMFWRGEEQTVGMGVGLGIVQRLIRKHRGRVWVESDGNMGSAFWIEIPRRVVPERA